MMSSAKSLLQPCKPGIVLLPLRFGFDQQGVDLLLRPDHYAVIVGNDQVAVLAHEGNEGWSDDLRSGLKRTDPGREDVSPFGRVRCERRGKPGGKLIHCDLPFKTF